MAATGYRTWGDRDEDITRLPEGWEARVSDDSRVFFVNHSEQATQWDHPTSHHRYKVPPGLPYGWQRFKDDNDTITFVDHINQLSTFMDPRLLNSTAFEFPVRYDIKDFVSIKNKFRSLVKSSEVLRNVDLSKKVAIVTGANSGLGFQTTLSLATGGAHVVLACRDPIKAEAAIVKILQIKPDAKVEAMHLDLSSLRSVKSFAEEFINRRLPLHILVCNAGVFGGPLTLTVDGLEKHFAVNHLGHFYLVTLLVEVLRSSKPSRVIMVTSESHWYPCVASMNLPFYILRHPSIETYSAITTYGASKLCNLLFMLEFHQQYADLGISCNAVHPGNLLQTNLMRNAGLLYKAGVAVAKGFTKSVEQATSTIVYCAVHPSMDNISGLYMYECWPAMPSPEAQDLTTAAALWQLSEQLIADKMASA